MATQQELLQQVGQLINELEQKNQPKIEFTGPVSTTMDILGKSDLTIMQRAILLYLAFGQPDWLSNECPQRNISNDLHISMKCARENCEQLAKLDYIKRGTKASTWSLVN